MTAAERPSALLARLRHTSPLVQRALLAAVGLGLVTTSTVIVQAVSLASALGYLFEGHRAGLGQKLVLFTVATVARAFASGLAVPVTTRIAAPLRRDLRRRAMRQVLRQGAYGSVDATVQLCTRGIEAIESYVANYVPAVVLATLTPAVLLVWMGYHDPLSGAILLMVVLLLPLFMVLLGLEAKEKMHDRWREQQTLASYFGDVVRGMTVLKSFNRSRDAVDRLDEVGVALRRSTMATLKVAFLSSFALELLSSLATALVALVLGVRLLNGSLSLSVALAVLLLTPEVFLPLRRSSARYHASSVGIAAASDLLDFLDAERGTGVQRAPSTPPSLELVDVTLAHDGRHPFVEAPIDAMIGKGTLVSVMGRSGAGKTTLLRILCGLDKPRTGVVLVDGVELPSLDLDSWQGIIAWLPQDPKLPGATVREVVRMGDDDIDDSLIRSTLTELKLDLDLDRALGEGASELSAGQRCRLALARCLVRRPLLLVLDEPTAHLDPESAELVMSVIARLSMTRVVATHQSMDADQIIHLDSSGVVRVH
jgi:ABC-type transport system involved in cytochrome bd biosynthesis fused ATPase/permease subunit